MRDPLKISDIGWGKTLDMGSIKNIGYRLEITDMPSLVSIQQTSEVLCDQVVIPTLKNYNCFDHSPYFSAYSMHPLDVFLS